jgi:hypothetical protein
VLKAFRQVYLGSDILQRLQDNVASSLNRLLSVVILDGLIIKVKLEAGVAKAFDHRLGRLPEGWIVVDKDAAATVYSSATATAQSLTLTSDVDVNLKLWVF